MYFVRRNPQFKFLNTFIRLYSKTSKTHYEVLNLRRNCTDKEIKEAFIQKSKEYHPDKNKDVKAQEHFVRVVEAYNVLSKPSTRAQYDSLTDTAASYGNTSTYVYKTHVPYNLRNNPQYSYFYEGQNKSHSGKERTKAYYGVAGVKKVPNYVVIAICFGIAIIGLIVQMFVIRESFIINQRRAQERSMMLAEELDKARTAARENGNETQTRLLLDKIVQAAKPTVATATLGQALATEKK